MNRVILGPPDIDSSRVSIASGGSTRGARISLSNWQQQARYANLVSHRIAYWVAGNPEHETIVFVHGFPSAAWDWQHLWSELSKHYRVVALDLLGYGYSDKPRNYAYSLIEQADILMELTEQLGIERYHLLTHDYGVTVGQEVLARHNERSVGDNFLLSYCLLNGGAFPESQNQTIGMILMRGPLGPYLIKLANQRRFSQRFAEVFGEDTQPTEEELDGYWQLANEQQGLEVFPNLLRYIDERHKRRDRWVGAITNATIPVRTIVGTEDTISGENMLKRYEEIVPQPDVVRLPGIGHYPQIEAPELVLAAYKNFLDRI